MPTGGWGGDGPAGVTASAGGVTEEHTPPAAGISRLRLSAQSTELPAQKACGRPGASSGPWSGRTGWSDAGTG